jgi:hypothetical protein
VVEAVGRREIRAAERGSLLLLDHCARLERLTTRTRLSARERLEAELGGELTRALLGTLCGASIPAPSRALSGP